ncbi:MAG: acetyltransferase [Nocardioides sp.]|nr:acetyltransferase [Nocardioides sp.]
MDPREPATLRELGEPGDLGWVVMTHGEVYAREFGWDARFEEVVATIVGDFARAHDADRERAWVALVDGRRAGCVFCVRDPEDPSSARLRVLLVDPAARGHGIGGRLVDQCVGFAREAGYARVTLWTNSVLTSAQRIYRAAGFVLVDEERHHSFGHDLTGQNWELDLRQLQ